MVWSFVFHLDKPPEGKRFFVQLGTAEMAMKIQNNAHVLWCCVADIASGVGPCTSLTIGRSSINWRSKSRRPMLTPAAKFTIAEKSPSRSCQRLSVKRGNVARND